jgi:hypothetical protein
MRDGGNSSMALVVLDKAKQIESKYFAGDPSTTFHEIRRFLFTQGVDTKLYSSARVLNMGERQTSYASSEVKNSNNSFFSEFRSMVAVESAEQRLVLNTLIFVLRVVIDAERDGNSGTVQLLLNHLHDGIFELNDMYSALFQFLDENHWENVRPGPEMTEMSVVSNSVFTWSFSGVHQFTAMYHKLKPILVHHQMVGSNLPIEAPF